MLYAECCMLHNLTGLSCGTNAYKCVKAMATHNCYDHGGPWGQPNLLPCQLLGREYRTVTASCIELERRGGRGPTSLNLWKEPSGRLPSYSSDNLAACSASAKGQRLPKNWHRIICLERPCRSSVILLLRTPLDPCRFMSFRSFQDTCY